MLIFSDTSNIAYAAQGSILGPLVFLTYINNLSYDLTSNPKFLVDDASLFSAVENMSKSASNLNSDCTWALQ